MAINNPREALLYSGSKVDQILNVYTGSLVVAGTGGILPQVRYDIAGNAMNETAFIKGIISFDSGASWQSACWIGRIPTGAAPQSYIFPAVFPSGISILASNDGAAFTILYKLFVFAKPGQLWQYPPTTLVNNIVFSSKYNYQKIAQDAVTTDFTYDHNMGYVPKVSVFNDFDIGGEICLAPYASNDSVYISTSSIVVPTDVFLGLNNYFRVYHDG